MIEWDAISQLVSKASSESCYGMVPTAAGLPELLRGGFSTSWAVALLK